MRRLVSSQSLPMEVTADPTMTRRRSRVKLKVWTMKQLGLIVILGLAAFSFLTATAMTPSERRDLRDESRDMFYHAFRAYMENAFPADELMPLSCRGRFRGREPSRGDIDDALGNFSLTLIDSLDTLVIMGDLDEFEDAVRLVIDTVSFDHDIVVSVFETNIRIVGGLLSGHILAEYLHDRMNRMPWYQGELLNMALDIGNRLLPAFNSSTGLPHPRINLRYGIKPGTFKYIGETCTACAGTMILEFAALSRLSGEPIFEEKASAAMDVLWSSRNRMSNLVGNVVNINTGDWVRRDSGVGAGIDSYYEYVAKAYVLLGEEKYLSRWNTHYSAVMKYLGQGPLLQDVLMHRPHSTSKHFVDALAAFFPGLQVLMGDLKPAIESHEVLYQILQRHNFIPEAFTLDYQVHWGQHLLRPEFVESTYFLYRATGDEYYLDVGKQVLQGLQKHARVTCGYATIKDVRTMQLEDRMDSFVLAETFKYLYLLFANESDLVVDIGNFVFTTEGHLLPLSLARLSNRTAVPLSENAEEIHDEDVEFSRACPSTDFLFPDSKNFAESIRGNFANVVEEKCPAKAKSIKRKLTGAEFQSNNPDHLRMVKEMGISILSLSDGRVQLLHTFANAKSTSDAEEGLLFMQEMIEMSKQQSNQHDTPPKVVSFTTGKDNKKINLFAGPAQFGRQFEGGFTITGEVIKGDPINGCKTLNNGQKFWGNIGVVERGDCMFVEKARVLENVGAKAGIVIDNNKGSSSANMPLFAMSGDGTDDVSIPVVFLFSEDAKLLLNALEIDPLLKVTIQDSLDMDKAELSDMVTPLTSGKTQAPNLKVMEILEEETEEPFDITSPVSSFLERSKRQVEQYFRSLTSSPPAPASDLNNEDSDVVHVLEDGVDENGQRVRVSFTKTDLENGKSFVAVEHLDENGKALSIEVQELDMSEMKAVESNLSSESSSNSNKVDNPDDQPSQTFGLGEFLHPDSSSIRRLIEHRVLKQPNVLSELLQIKFSDLLRVFHYILDREADGSLEAAYVKLFQLIDEGGAEAVRKKSDSIPQNSDKGGKAPKNRKSFLTDTLDDLTINQMLDDQISKFLTDPTSDRKKQVKAASILELLNDDLLEKLSASKAAVEKDKPVKASTESPSVDDDYDELEDPLDLTGKDEL